ncbi:MAG: hypothetical protein J2P59_09050 [Acidimicrobiales bacterium]|nr:hypothetical protein [Acidimicrobiales bacterium]
MADTTSRVAPVVAIPEPELSPEEIVGRARALIPEVRDQQDEAERLGHHTPELDRKFVEAGFYRMLQPRLFGGYEFDLVTFWRAMLAIAEGDPGTGWGVTLGAHHALVIGSHFSEEGQREIFGPSGDFRCPHRPPPRGRARPVDGGYVVSGTWDYCSGIAHATHFMGNALAGPGDGDEGETNLAVVIPRDQVTVLDDWGNGSILGMNSSGSNSVTVEEVFVPTHCTAVANWRADHGATAGTELHHNPMYLGRLMGVYHAGLVVPVVGAARAALAEYEHIITTRNTHRAPFVPRYTKHEFQQAYGQALAFTDAAEALVIRAGQMYMEHCRRWETTGQLFTKEDDARLFAILQQAGQLAGRAVQVIFNAASSSAAKRGQRIQRYYRDTAMYLGHFSAQYLRTSVDLACVHFGLPDELPA